MFTLMVNADKIICNSLKVMPKSNSHDNRQSGPCLVSVVVAAAVIWIFVGTRN